MASDLFKVKLNELDERLSRLHSNLNLLTNVQKADLKIELNEVIDEFENRKKYLYAKLKNSKNKTALELFDIYEKVESMIDEFIGEKKDREAELLIAEYALDFSLEAINRAEILALRAIYAKKEGE